MRNAGRPPLLVCLQRVSTCVLREPFCPIMDTSRDGSIVWWGGGNDCLVVVIDCVDCLCNDYLVWVGCDPPQRPKLWRFCCHEPLGRLGSAAVCSGRPLREIRRLGAHVG